MSIQFYKKLPNTLQSVKLQNIFQRSGRLTAWIQFLPPRSPDLVSPPVFEMNFHVINISFFAGSCHRIYVLDLGTSLCLCRTSSTKSCPAVSKQFTTLQQPTSTRTRVLWNNKHASKIVGTFWFPLLRTSSLSQRMPPDLTLWLHTGHIDLNHLICTEIWMSANCSSQKNTFESGKWWPRMVRGLLEYTLAIDAVFQVFSSTFELCRYFVSFLA